MNVTWLNKERFVFLLAFLFLVSSGVNAMKDRPETPAIGDPKVDIGDKYKHDRPETILNRRLVDEYVPGPGDRNPFTWPSKTGPVARVDRHPPAPPPVKPPPPPPIKVPPAKPKDIDVAVKPAKPREDPVPFAFLGFKRMEADGVTYVWLLDKRTQADHDVFKGHPIPNSDLKLVEVTLQSVIVQNKKGQRYRWKSNDQQWEPVR